MPSWFCKWSNKQTKCWTQLHQVVEEVQIFIHRREGTNLAWWWGRRRSNCGQTNSLETSADGGRRKSLVNLLIANLRCFTSRTKVSRRGWMESHKSSQKHSKQIQIHKNSDTYLLAKAVYMPHREQRVISHMEMVYFTTDCEKYRQGGQIGKVKP